MEMMIKLVAVAICGWVLGKIVVYLLMMLMPMDDWEDEDET